jgi:peptide chain release factor 2
MQDLLKKYEALLSAVQDAIDKLGIDDLETQAEALTNETLKPDFWSSPGEAASKSQQLAGLTKQVDAWRGLEHRLTDEIEALREFGNDADYLKTAAQTYEQLSGEFAGKESELKLSGRHDRSNAILEIHAGTGGTDAQDWAEMLERMYLRWAEAHGYEAEVLSLSPGEEAGLKSVTIEINGPLAYGKLRGEAGVHRLVRLSPFNSDNLRQTSFALVEVLPKLEQQTDLEIDPGELRVDVYRSGGHGGQSVNTTDSAVRITHLPTGLVVAIQNERSQLQNREKAMAVLKARLASLMEQQHLASLKQLRSSDKSAEWGQQIRNYVLHPYTKVKDLRSGFETSDADAVLAGDLDPFIDAYLTSQIGSSDGPSNR